MNDCEEFPLVFDICGSRAVGIVHKPCRISSEVGIIMVPGGGPQYRAGLGRQLVTWARRFAVNGHTVMRFDYRGMGDSEGEYQPFYALDEDLRAAVDALSAAEQQLSHIVFWGGCNAASAIAMYAASDSRVSGMILSNPWIYDEENRARSMLRNHYARRLGDPLFWRSLFSGKVNILKAAGGVIETVKKYLGSKATGDTPTHLSSRDEVSERPPQTTSASADYLRRMLEGFATFEGRALVLNSSGVVADEFNEKLRTSQAWKRAFDSPNFTRENIGNTGHNFADKEGGNAVFDASLRWISLTFTGALNPVKTAQRTSGP